MSEPSLRLVAPESTSVPPVQAPRGLTFEPGYIFFLSKSVNVEIGAWHLNGTQAPYSVDGHNITDGGFALSFEELDRLTGE